MDIINTGSVVFVNGVKIISNLNPYANEFYPASVKQNLKVVSTRQQNKKIEPDTFNHRNLNSPNDTDLNILCKNSKSKLQECEPLETRVTETEAIKGCLNVGDILEAKTPNNLLGNNFEKKSTFLNLTNTLEKVETQSERFTLNHRFKMIKQDEQPISSSLLCTNMFKITPDDNGSLNNGSHGIKFHKILEKTKLNQDPLDLNADIIKCTVRNQIDNQRMDSQNINGQPNTGHFRERSLNKAIAQLQKETQELFSDDEELSKIQKVIEHIIDSSSEDEDEIKNFLHYVKNNNFDKYNENDIEKVEVESGFEVQINHMCNSQTNIKPQINDVVLAAKAPPTTPTDDMPINIDSELDIICNAGKKKCDLMKSRIPIRTDRKYLKKKPSTATHSITIVGSSAHNRSSKENYNLNTTKDMKRTVNTLKNITHIPSMRNTLTCTLGIASSEKQTVTGTKRHTQGDNTILTKASKTKQKTIKAKINTYSTSAIISRSKPKDAKKKLGRTSVAEIQHVNTSHNIPIKNITKPIVRHCETQTN